MSLVSKKKKAAFMCFKIKYQLVKRWLTGAVDGTLMPALAKN